MFLAFGAPFGGGNAVYELPEPQVASSATKVITGVVTDSKGEPVIGASVVEPGTTRGTVRNQLELLDTNKHPNVARGANIKNATVSFTTDGDYMNPSPVLYGGKQRTFNSKYKLYPIPSEQRGLNNALTQNPGWE